MSEAPAAVAARRVAGSGTGARGARQRVHLIPVDDEARAALEDEVQLLVVAGAGAETVVVIDHLAAHLAAGVGVDAEGSDPERDPDRIVTASPSKRSSRPGGRCGIRGRS